jgi:hypothetical protein
MLPKLVYNLGLIALTAALTAMVAGPRFRVRADTEYDLTIKKGADGVYYFDPKPGRFHLDFHGQVRWNVYNATADEFTFTMDEFKKYAGDCPLDFLGNTGNTLLCKGEVRLPGGQAKPIKARRYRSNANALEVFDFKTKVDGTSIDPEIEIDRDPYGLIILLAISGGVLVTVVGWWLLRRQR